VPTPFRHRLVGAIVRKQLFVTLYAYFVYAHFILNVIVVVICLLMLAHDEKTDVVKLCQNAIQDPQAKAQCTGLLNITEDIFISVAAFVLFIELCKSIIRSLILLDIDSNRLRHNCHTLCEPTPI